MSEYLELSNINLVENIDAGSDSAAFVDTPNLLPGQRLEQIGQSLGEKGYTTNIGDLVSEFFEETNNTFGDWAENRQRTGEQLDEIEALNNEIEYADHCDPPDLTELQNEVATLEIEPLDV